MKITIITVCYNSIDTIEDTILSVINQGYKNKEYIIIDGNSTDGTKDIIKRYKEKLAYYCSEADEGIYDAMNKGVSHATGEVIAFLNSDDWYEEDVLDKVNLYFQESDADMISGNIYHIINERKFPNIRKENFPEDIRVQMICPHQALFVRKKIFEQLGGFDLKYKIAADYEWVLKAYVRGAKLQKVEDVFANCRRGGISSVKAYECMYEQKMIAYSYLSEGTETVSRDMIDQYYNTIFEDSLLLSTYYRIFEGNFLSVRKLLPKGIKIYIWGTGIWGERCYCLFKRINLDIIAFIDAYKKQDMLHDFPIITPEKISDEGIICISSKKYEEEIIRRIQLLGIKEERYFCFSRLILNEELKRMGDCNV